MLDSAQRGRLFAAEHAPAADTHERAKIEVNLAAVSRALSGGGPSEDDRTIPIDKMTLEELAEPAAPTPVVAAPPPAPVVAAPLAPPPAPVAAAPAPAPPSPAPAPAPVAAPATPPAVAQRPLPGVAPIPVAAAAATEISRQPTAKLEQRPPAAAAPPPGPPAPPPAPRPRGRHKATMVSR